MPTKKNSAKTTNSKSRVSISISKRFNLSKVQLIVLASIFGLIGSYILIRSFAASNTTYNLNEPPVGIAPAGSNSGYWIGASDGGVFAQGTAVFHGSLGATVISAPIVDIAATPDRGGYYMVGSDGAVYAYGDAVYKGGVNNAGTNGSSILVSGAHMVGIAAHTGGGYWLIDNEGHTYAFGGAPSFGYNPTGFSGSIVDIAPDASGTGYFAVSSYGQVYALGGAGNCGNAPAGVTNIVRVVANTGGSGCWLLGSDGGVFAYGNAPFLGSIASAAITGRAVGIASTSTGKGYWIQASDGGVFSFGDAEFQGRVVYNPPTAVISAAPLTITWGSNTTLTWATTNTQQVSITSIGNVGASGSQAVSPQVNTTYSLEASGGGGSITTSVTVNVNCPTGWNRVGTSCVEPPPPPAPVASLLWPFATKSSGQYERIDQGWDIQTTPGASVYAISSGVIEEYNPDPGGFGNDYPTEILDNSIGGPSNYVYYGHVHVVPSLIGQHVNAGQLIAYTNTTDPQNGSAAPTGWLEIGFAKPGSDAPFITGGEGAATSAGTAMHDILINAPVGP